MSIMEIVFGVLIVITFAYVLAHAGDEGNGNE